MGRRPGFRDSDPSGPRVRKRKTPAEMSRNHRTHRKGELRMAEKTMNSTERDEYWKRTSTLMWTILVLWFVFSFVVHFFAIQLNQIRVLGFPLGYYMAAQGSLVIFVILCFWNASAQDKIDNEFGVSDE